VYSAHSFSLSSRRAAGAESAAFLENPGYRKGVIQRRIPNPFRNRDYESEVYFK
jgi:hypothetical protein